MGIWDTYCPLCGLPFNKIDFNSLRLNYECDLVEVRKYINNTYWLEDFGLLIDNEFITDGIIYDYNGSIFYNNKQYFIDYKYLRKNDNFGFLIHNNCYKLTNKKKIFYKILNHLDNITDNSKFNIQSGYLDGIDYNFMGDYANQEYNWDNLIRDFEIQVLEIASNPLENEYSKHEILEIINQINKSNIFKDYCYIYLKN